MTIRVNHDGKAHLKVLIEAGKYNTGKAWSFSAEDGNKLLGAKGDDWGRYAGVHLGEDAAANDKTKDRWKYPAAKATGASEEVYREGLIAAKRRAAQQGETDIANAADALIAQIDQKESRKRKSAQRRSTMNFMSSTALQGPYGHLSALFSLPRKAARRAASEEESRRSRRAKGADEHDPDGRDPDPEGDNKPHAEDDGEGAEAGRRAAGSEGGPEDPNRPGGEAGRRVAHETGHDGDEGDDDENDDDDDDEDEDDQDDADEAEMRRCEAAGHGRALRAARRAERKRIRAIFRAPVAAGRVAAAAHLACETDLSARKAIGLLASIPAETAGRASLGSRMAEQQQPRVGQDHPGPARQTPGASLAAAVRRLETPGGKDDTVGELAAALADRLTGR